MIKYLKVDFDCCVYCGEPWDHWDHVFPRSKAWKLPDCFTSWMMPSCSECNWVAGARIFRTFGDKTRFIQEKLKERYNNYLDDERIQKRVTWRLQSLEDEVIVTKIGDEILAVRKAIIIEDFVIKDVAREELEDLILKDLPLDEYLKPLITKDAQLERVVADSASGRLNHQSEEKICKSCRESFVPLQQWRKFCCKICTEIWENRLGRSGPDSGIGAKVYSS